MIEQDKSSSNNWYSEKMWMKKADLFEENNLNLSTWNFVSGTFLKRTEEILNDGFWS
jgi:hypothetical protein